VQKNHDRSRGAKAPAEVRKEAKMNQITDPDAIAFIIEGQRAADRHREALILAAMRAYPKRRGELRAEWERRLLRIVREAR